MIINEFPDLSWLKKRTESGFTDGKAWNGKKINPNGWPTVILNVKTNSEIIRPDIKGTLSLFLNISGESFASVGPHRVKVDNNSFFLSNEGERYSLEINKTSKTETFNIHFGLDFCEKLFYSLEHKEEFLLDNPNEKSESVAFYSQLYQRSAEFNSVIQRLIAANKEHSDTDLFIEESLQAVALMLFKENYSVKKHANKLSAVKHTTRSEIVRRILIAKDYVHSFYYKDIKLDELAEVSSLSKFHFLRHFSEFTGTTPHSFLTHRRIEKAKEFLKTDRNLSVSDVSYLVGYKDASSFSRAFKNHTGLYPTQL